RAHAGACPGRYAMLLDEWALTGAENAVGSESGNCAVLEQGRCQNPAYYRLINRVYDSARPGRAGEALASVVNEDPGVDESKFWMSFVGSDSAFNLPFTDEIGPEQMGQRLWQTTPFSRPPQYGASYLSRSE